MLICLGLFVLELGIEPRVTHTLHQYTVTYFSFGDKVSLSCPSKPWNFFCSLACPWISNPTWISLVDGIINLCHQAELYYCAWLSLSPIHDTLDSLHLYCLKVMKDDADKDTGIARVWEQNNFRSMSSCMLTLLGNLIHHPKRIFLTISKLKMLYPLAPPTNILQFLATTFLLLVSEYNCLSIIFGWWSESSSQGKVGDPYVLYFDKNRLVLMMTSRPKLLLMASCPSVDFYVS